MPASSSRSVSQSELVSARSGPSSSLPIASSSAFNARAHATGQIASPSAQEQLRVDPGRDVVGHDAEPAVQLLEIARRPGLHDVHRAEQHEAGDRDHRRERQREERDPLPRHLVHHHEPRVLEPHELRHAVGRERAERRERRGRGELHRPVEPRERQEQQAARRASRPCPARTASSRCRGRWRRASPARLRHSEPSTGVWGGRRGAAPPHASIARCMADDTQARAQPRTTRVRNRRSCSVRRAGSNAIGTSTAPTSAIPSVPTSARSHRAP